MAIQLNDIRAEHKQDYKLASTVTTALERGMIMTEVNDGGLLAVRPCALAGGERVLGALWSSLTDQADVPTFQDVVVSSAPGPYTVALTKTPLASTDRLTRIDTGALLTGGGVDYTLTGNVITFNAALAGIAVHCVFRFAITAQELQRRGGRRSINNGPEGLYGNVTIAYGQCALQLSTFLTTVAYLPMDQVLTAANGQFRTGGGGTAFGRCTSAPALLASPGIDQLFVGVEFNTPLAP